MGKLSKANLAFNAIVAERNDASELLEEALARLNRATAAAYAIDPDAASALDYKTYELHVA
jgi:hypothetical protein